MVHTRKLLDLSLDPDWESVHTVREKTNAVLKAERWSRDLVDAVTMCITELTENAIKYGNDVHTDTQIRAKIAVIDNLITVTVTNRVNQKSDLNSLIRHIDELKVSETSRDLHVEKLKEIMKYPEKVRSELGLYRISHEGNFVIEYRIETDVLFVEATRPIVKTI